MPTKTRKYNTSKTRKTNKPGRKGSTSKRTSNTFNSNWNNGFYGSFNGNMPKFNSPFASAFTSAINRGTPCFVAVNNIANRTNKTPNTVFESLYKAGLCWRQKVGGQWIYFPCFTPKKGTSNNIKNCQGNMWQWFVDWCITSGYCTPSQLHNNCGSSTQFMNFCKKFWGKQFNTTTGSKTTSRSSNKSFGRTGSTPKSYKFPTVSSRSYGKRKVA
ncbi:MAG TPA: hypothetical protein PK400_05610 [Phycisphaerales bacterium]|nr:hypothetical protein [Phycisphaerales bacterium]HRQ75090.1 hypothetical protein [Phycisphaerales bacterium]